MLTQQQDLAKVLEELAKRRATESSSTTTSVGTPASSGGLPPSPLGQTTQAQNTSYYPALATQTTSGSTSPGYTGVSIVDYLNFMGQPSDYTSRSVLAAKYGIKNYSGTAEQNTQLLNTLRGGTSTTGGGLPPSPLGQTTQEKNTSYTYNPTTPIDQAKEIVSNSNINVNNVNTGSTQDTSGVRDKLDEERKAEEQTEIDNFVKSQQEIINNQNELAKLKVQSEIADYKRKLGITDESVKSPADVNFTSTYQTLREQNNVTGLENSINNITAQTTALQDSLTEGLYDEEGKLRPMELISARKNEMSRQVQEKLNTLNRSKENLVNELATKNTLISNIMEFKQLDYNNAKAEYESAYDKQLQFIQLSRDIENEAESDEQALKDSATANLNTVVNMLTGQSFNTLDPSLQNKIIELELKAGLPSGMTQSFLENKKGAEILTTVNGYDADGNQLVTIIYKDPETGMAGTIATYSTGGVKTPDEESVTPFITQEYLNGMFDEDKWTEIAKSENLRTGTGVFGSAGPWNDYDINAAKLKLMASVNELRTSGYDDEEIYDILEETYGKKE